MEGASQERGEVRGIRRFAPDTPDCMVLGFRRRLRLQPSCSLPLGGGEWEARRWEMCRGNGGRGQNVFSQALTAAKNGW